MQFDALFVTWQQYSINNIVAILLKQYYSKCNNYRLYFIQMLFNTIGTPGPKALVKNSLLFDTTNEEQYSEVTHQIC